VADKITALMAQIHLLQDELEQEFAHRQNQFNFKIEQRKITFAQDVARQHALLKRKLMPYLAGAHPLVVLTAPIIYAMIIPFLLLDLFVTLYQAICFPVYGIEKVKRAGYITFDRDQLSYLNAVEKLNCAYCSYGNGLLAYATEIAARTEKRWCPIKHAKRMPGAHRHYHDFLDYGDAEGYRRLQSKSPKNKVD
jgi:hypothetical protein